MKRRILFLLFCFLLLSILPRGISASAEESTDTADTLPEEYGALLDALPEELRELLPDALFSENTSEVHEAVKEMSSFSYLLQTVLSIMGLHLSECLNLLASVCGLLLLSAVLHALSTAFQSDAIGKAFSLCTSLALLLSLLRFGGLGFREINEYLTRLETLTAATIPLTGALYAMGGNVATAVATTAGLSAYFTLLQGIIGSSILPFCYVCLTLSALNAANEELAFGSLLSTIKKNYTTLLGFLMMLLLAMLSMQSTLGAKSDTLAMRSVKFAAGSFIPVLGGSVSELLRTVGASVGYLRSTVGICVVLLLLLTLLPTLIHLFLLRLTWQLCGSIAHLLKCKTEERLLDEFASLNGYLIAAASICSSVLMLSVTLLAHCAAAMS